MLQEAYIYRWLNVTKLKTWCSILLIMLILINIFSPVISFITFRIHFDKHLVECQQHRHHGEDCQASCILEEMMAEQAEAIPEKTSSFVYFFPDLFFLKNQLTSNILLKEVLIVDLFSHYLMFYSPPILRMHSPPPKLY